MTYYKINLNKLEDPRIAVIKARREIFAYCFLLMGFIALTVTLLYFNGRLSGKQAQFLALKKKIEHEIQILEQSEDFVSESEVRDLSRLNRDRVFWAKKLERLTHLMDDDIAITRIKFNGKKLLIAGITKFSPKSNHFTDVSNFIKKLQVDPDFSKDFKNILFESSSRIEFDNQEIVHFEIMCHKGGKS